MSRNFASLGLKLAALAAASAALAGCHANRIVTNDGPPLAYDQRHAIKVVDSERTMKVYVGPGRGHLTDSQRAEIYRFAGDWHRRSTSVLSVRVPSGTSNEVATRDVLREIGSLIDHARVPRSAVQVSSYAPVQGSTELPPILMDFRELRAAVDSQCGLWPEDLGPASVPSHFENRTYWNFGCAYQKNMAAMIADPHDLAQPKGATPALAGRQVEDLNKYRTGQDPGTAWKASDGGKVAK